jgi:hypothetical protein
MEKSCHKVAAKKHLSRFETDKKLQNAFRNFIMQSSEEMMLVAENIHDKRFNRASA